MAIVESLEMRKRLWCGSMERNVEHFKKRGAGVAEDA